MTRSPLFTILLLGAWLLPGAEAQQPSPTFGRYQLDVWRAQDGVRLAYTSNLVQTRDGYLWLSSESGVTRFDGVRFKVFDGSNTPALQGRPRLQTVPLLEDGATLYPEANRMSREEALRLFTEGSAWFSGEEKDKGILAAGRLADFAVLTEDYFSVPVEEIKSLESVLTVVDGKVVYGAGPFADLSQRLPPVSPDWSPVADRRDSERSMVAGGGASVHAHGHHGHHHHFGQGGLWGSGCDCFVF